MQQANFVCEKNPAHYFTRFSDNIDNRLPCISCDGWMHPAPQESTAIPFQLWCLIGGWKPVCAKHRRIFMFESRYQREHAACGGGNYPPGDAAIWSGYRKDWRP